MKLKTNFSHALPIILALAICHGRAQQQMVDPSNSGGMPSGGGNGDTMDFQADLLTGRFTYSVPIVVAPGRQGSEPKLTLGYNSGAGNGWCGVGWTLETSYIQRDGRHGVPILWGTTNGLPSYDDSKGFKASTAGAASYLVPVGPTNQNPIVYRQQVDTAWLTYNYYTNDYWTVIDKSGNTFYFGEGITNQMENSKTNWTPGICSSTFRWALDRVVDAHGNETFLNYTNDEGTLYLTRILYNGNVNSPAMAATNEVDFILTNRADSTISFLSGCRVTERELLAEVDVKAAGANVRKYLLAYTNSPSTTRSLLAAVTQYGSDFATALPSLTFNYQIENFGFNPYTNWLNQVSSPTWPYDRVQGINGSEDVYINIADIDGDGLPDRVMAQNATTYTSFVAERNTGAGFASASTNYLWSTLNNLDNPTALQWNCPAYTDVNGAFLENLVDLNGDGYPDRVLSCSTNSGLYVQTNSGLEGLWGFSANFTNIWAVTNLESNNYEWLAVGLANDYQSQVMIDMVDMNGDGLPDRVTTKVNAPYDRFRVELNNGNGFGPPVDWATLDSQGQTAIAWNCLLYNEPSYPADLVVMTDINGDGLPDRVMTQVGGPWTSFVVQFNNGAGFEPAESWGPLDNQGNNVSWGSPVGMYGPSYLATVASLVDINGDGLPDRVMLRQTTPYTNWIVQLNTGSGFGPPQIWGNLQSQGDVGDVDWNSLNAAVSGGGASTYVEFMDINGDGLPDRIMRSYNSPYTNLVVQTSKGPFPDLLTVVSNGVGGSVNVSYIASTTLNNRSKDWTNDPWLEGAKSLLPFNVWVVSKIISSDGLGDQSTNSYAFKGGYYNAPEREFRGFSQCTVTDPLGTMTTSYFHQSGGRDNSALGEYLDQGSESKKGIPFRVDVIGNDGKTNNITLNKVVEVMLNTNGWYFPYVAQKMALNYEGLSSGRATASQFSYDTNTENLVAETDFGEVTNVVFNGQTFTAVATNIVYTWMTYTNIGNILNRPIDTKMTSDSAGANRVQEVKDDYDGNGNLLLSQAWLSTAGNFIMTVSNGYDQYGNVTHTTDAAGITTTTTYDATYEQFPTGETTGTFTSSSAFDHRSGMTVSGTDIKGLVSSNTFDVFFRPTASYISTNVNGAPTLWQTKTSYALGGISNGVSLNLVESQANNAVDEVNGFITYTYADGVGRTIETRSESETNGQYRVANAVYDLRGNPSFQTVSYFSAGTNYTALSGTYLGALTAYDDIGRPDQSTAAVNGSFTAGLLTSTTPTGGDAGSPVGSATTAYVDGNNPWAVVVTDAQGKTRKTYRDGFGRSIIVIAVTTNGNYNTAYAYDLAGDLTNVTDSAGNPIALFYDSLGRKTTMIDPDMGTWSYVYDNAGRLTQQTDARTNALKFYYTDQLGRLTSKQIYNSSNSLVGTVTYTYDTSDDPTYTVYPGQLYKVTDLQGYERSSYDVRGRVLKDARYLTINSMEYVVQATYDDADRVAQLIYPNNTATIKYTYDTANHLIQVRSLDGTGTQEIFYTPQSFNALDQMTGYTCGNGVATAYAYYANSARLQNLTTGLHGTNYQNLSYSYNNVSDLTSINDAVNSGTASATQTGITYDDFYRVTSLNSTARGLKNYAYNAIGNVLTNQDAGSGLYQYGAKPHAVTSANGVTYGYDACGNMTARGNQTLAYDPQNQLIQVTSTNDNVVFGYDDSGERLWRSGTNGYTVWIGGIYEINDGKVLCHVIAGGQMVASFQPLCGGPWSKAFGEEHWYIASNALQSIFVWPFQHGRGPATIFAASWAAILGVCLVAGRCKVGQASSLSRERVRASSPGKSWITRLWQSIFHGTAMRRPLRFGLLWKQTVTLLAISAFLWTSTGDVEAATYSPVFYYYHPDHLGSTNVLTDRSGAVVQQYEYSTFGQISYQNNPSAFPVSNLYTSQIDDDETGLYYYGGRYYDPQLGRFIQPDPTTPDPTDSQSFNRYSYCSNNPLNLTDPTGFDDGDSGGGSIDPGMDGGNGLGDEGFGGAGTGGTSFGYYDGLIEGDAYIWLIANNGISSAPPDVSAPNQISLYYDQSAGGLSYKVGLVYDDQGSVQREETEGSPPAEQPPATASSDQPVLQPNAPEIVGPPVTASIPASPIQIWDGTSGGGISDQSMDMFNLFGAIGAAKAIVSIATQSVVKLAAGIASKIAANRGGQIVYRELSAADRARLDQGLGIVPKGTGGTIADQVAGNATEYVSASKTIAGTAKYGSGNGLVAIDVAKAVRGGAGFVPHENVMQAVMRQFTGTPINNARNASEVMFKGGIPFDAITPLW